MTRRSRIVGFGSAALLVVAGIVCAFLLSGGLAQNLAFVLVALGMVEATALVFYEVGLTEDRERAREDDARRRAEDRARRVRSPARTGRASRLERTRGRPRRLR